MVTIRGRKFEVVDAHVHIWDNYHGMRFGDTIIEKIGSGMIRVGENEIRT